MAIEREGSYLTHPKQSAFTLLELLVVVGLVVLLMTLVAPAFTALKAGSDITTAATTVAGAMEAARSYAKANNTYTWLGFYEEDALATAPTSTGPPYSGRGRLILGLVASSDGTKIYNDSDPAAALPSARIRQVGKLIRIDNVHVTDVGPPATPNSSDSLDGRPNWPFTNAVGIGADHYNRISSDSGDTTRFNFTTQTYTFYKTIRFSPRGEANLNSTYSIKNIAEIGLRPSHGNVVDSATRNVVAIQLTGIGGNVKIYRR